MRARSLAANAENVPRRSSTLNSVFAPLQDLGSDQTWCWQILRVDRLPDDELDLVKRSRVSIFYTLGSTPRNGEGAVANARPQNGVVGKRGTWRRKAVRWPSANDNA